MSSTAKKETGSKADSIRNLVHDASVVIAHYWPMRSFVHHNPIRHLEIYPFEEAVRIARRFVGGRGYLPNDMYRNLVTSGRIAGKHLTAAIAAIAADESLKLGDRTVKRFDVLRAHFLEGITSSADETVAALVERSGASERIRNLSQKLPKQTSLETQAPRIGADMTLATWCDNTLHTQVNWLIDREMIKWCEAFLDEEHAAWAMPKRDQGFYAAWKDLAEKEWSPCGIANAGSKILALPSSAEECLISHLDALGIPADLQQDYISHSLTALCGWASFINWRSENGDYEWQQAYPIDLVQYLAVRLFYEKELVAQTCRDRLSMDGTLSAVTKYAASYSEATTTDPEKTAKLASAWRLVTLSDSLSLPPSALEDASSEELSQLLTWLNDFPESEHGPIWLKAHEKGYADNLVGQLGTEAQKNASDAEEPVRPLAQAMFCIDVRSEPFRRNFESVGNYETIGFAGFFAIPIQSRALGDHHETDQFPAIVSAKYTVHEVPRQDQQAELKRHNAGAGFLHSLHEILHDLKAHVLTPYITVESIGWIFGVPLIGRTIFPHTYRKLRERIGKAIAPPVGTEMTADHTDHVDCELGLPAEDQAATIEAALKTMGLTSNFARLVVVCGHTNTSDNNPYEAALNCGACGGNSGKPNSRLFAAMANKPHVREHLAKNGIEVPEDTVFLGGVHDTTTDIVEIFDLEDVPDTHKQDLDTLKADLHKALLKTTYERATRLPGIENAPSPELVASEIGRRAGDWSETRPEWGLSSNASFIIGNRTLTRDINLEGRAFLNSYDHRIDPTGALLEGILNGPMVVGQWINAEHYFSATDPEIYGAGSKIYHNVVGRVGIMSGPQSDLRTGLAWQSVMSSGDHAYHEPVRLLVAIEAPKERILEIVQRQPVLTQLCDNEWIHLYAIDGSEGPYRYLPQEGWTIA